MFVFFFLCQVRAPSLCTWDQCTWDQGLALAFQMRCSANSLQGLGTMEVGPAEPAKVEEKERWCVQRC